MRRSRAAPRVADKIAKLINKDVARQARQFLWGADDSSKDFVEKHIGKRLDRVIIAEEQKRQARVLARSLADPLPA